MQWYHIVLIILLSILLLLLILDVIVANYVINVMVHPKVNTFNEAIDREIRNKKLTLDELNEYYKSEEFIIKSRYGYNLNGYYIKKKVDVKFKDNKERVVILSHGWTALAQTMYAYGKMYLQKGFHVFALDHINHGKSDKKVTTMGDKEADDLQTLIEMIYEKIGYDCIIGIHGESMGSATAMINAGRYHSVNFLVEDCGYNDLSELCLYLLKKIKYIPTYPTFYLAKLIYLLKTKRKISEASPIKYLQTCDDIPILFVHGDEDDFVPSYMVYKCYDNKPNYKKVKLYKCDYHAHCIVDHKELYQKDLYDFLYDINVIDEK